MITLSSPTSRIRAAAGKGSQVDLEGKWVGTCRHHKYETGCPFVAWVVCSARSTSSVASMQPHVPIEVQETRSTPTRVVGGKKNCGRTRPTLAGAAHTSWSAVAVARVPASTLRRGGLGLVPCKREVALPLYLEHMCVHLFSLYYIYVV